MTRDTDRESPDALPLLPNVLLVLVLVLLLVWGIGGLYLPDTAATSSADGVAAVEPAHPKPAGNVLR